MTTSLPLLGTVLDQIGSEIVTGTIPNGARFTLQDISARFGISRTVARESMRALEQLGLVTSSRRIGITVAPMSQWATLNPSIIAWRLANAETHRAQRASLQQLRQVVEPQAAELAAMHASSQQRDALEHLSKQQLDDASFYRTLYAATGNEMFTDLARSLEPALLPHSSPAQAELAEAIAAGDVTTARRVATELAAA